MMKQLHLAIIAIVFSFTVFGQNDSDLILNITTHVDHVDGGAKGILINYQLNIGCIKSKYPNDSLRAIAVNFINFKSKITAWNDEKQLKAGYGFQTLTNENGFFEMNKSTSPDDAETKIGIIKCKIFIPYSTLKLETEKQQLKWKLEISTKDGKNIGYSQQKEVITEAFTPPATSLFSVKLDSLIVNFFDSRGQAWDRSMFGSDAPDLDFSIYIGGVQVGNIYKGNSYTIVFSEKPRLFKFAISENDEINSHITDVDNIFHDQIASWKFDSTNMKKGIDYFQTESKTNLKSFSFSCRVD